MMKSWSFGYEMEIKDKWNISKIMHLSNEHVLELKNIVFVPSIIINLISIATLNLVGYFYYFGNAKFDLHYNSYVLSYGALSNSLYQISLDLGFVNFINLMVGKKRNKINGNSSML